MYKIILLCIVTIFSVSCSLHEPKGLRPQDKGFAQEDTYILFALRAEQVKDNKSASDLFAVLYNKSGKKEYLYRSLENDLLAHDSEKLIQRVNAVLVDNEYDTDLIRLKIVALIDMNELDEAIKLSVALAGRTKNPKDYLLTSEVYIKRQEFDLAVRYLESAYAKESNEEILDKMSIVLYVNLNKKKEAIAHLETHSRMLGCSKLVCMRLIAFYSNDNNIDGLLSTYLRLYKLDHNPKLAIKIIQIYTYKQDYFNLMLFLEESKSDDEALLQLYSSAKSYTKAYHLADKLYAKTSEIDYLGQSAIFEYESAKDRKSNKLLLSVVAKLEKVTSLDTQAIYLNYLGYILIDNDINIKKGMQYIDEVLKIQPNSGYYLDSKAWGYYKLGKCKKAQKLINKVVTLEGGDDEEVLEHLKMIKSCVQKNRLKVE